MRRTGAAGAVILAFVAGVVLGIGGMSLRGGPAPAAVPSFAATGTLQTLPPGPITVIAETVRLEQGFTNRHHHGGPTFTFVVAGRARITEDDGTSREYGPGEFFFEPAGRPHALEVLSDVRFDVLRLLPPGAAATTTLPAR